MLFEWELLLRFEQELFEWELLEWELLSLLWSFLNESSLLRFEQGLFFNGSLCRCCGWELLSLLSLL